MSQVRLAGDPECGEPCSEEGTPFSLSLASAGHAVTPAPETSSPVFGLLASWGFSGIGCLSSRLGLSSWASSGESSFWRAFHRCPQ